MTSLTHPTTAAHVVTNRLAINRMGLWLFMFSESWLFAAFLTARFFVTGMTRPPELNQSLGLLITGVLLLSSFSAYSAEMCAARGDQKGLQRNLLFTVGLALLFLVGVGIEWAEAFHAFPPRTAFGTQFFTLTGLHAFHVLSGTGVLLSIYGMARRGRFGPGNYWGVEGAVKYWHFVDLAWVFIYPTLYLVG